MGIDYTLKIKLIPKQILFYGATYLWVIHSMLTNTYFNPFLLKEAYVEACVVFLLFGSILVELKYTAQELLIAAAGLVWEVYIFTTQSDVNQYLIMFLFIIAAREIGNFESIIKHIFKIELVIFIVTVIAARLGMIKSESTYRNMFGTIVGGERHYLGFTYLLAPMFLFFMYLMFIGYQKEKTKIWHLFLFEIANFYLFKQCDVKAPFFYLNVAILLTILLKFIKKPLSEMKIVKIVLKYYMVICALTSIGLQYFYYDTNPVYDKLNHLLTGRLRLGYEAIERYGFTLFGQMIRWNKDNTAMEYRYVDSSYLKYTLMFGTVTMVVVIAAFTFLLHRLIQNNNKYLVLAIILVATYSMFDPQLFYFIFNPFILLIGYYAKEVKQKGTRRVKITGGRYYEGSSTCTD